MYCSLEHNTQGIDLIALQIGTMSVPSCNLINKTCLEAAELCSFSKYADEQW